MGKVIFAILVISPLARPGAVGAESIISGLMNRVILLGFRVFYLWHGGAEMNILTLAFLGFGIIVFIGFVIIFMDKGLKWKKER